ncbi:MAG TPA: DUF1538 domain-containing protein [Peptococcaceae bacterium]|nr:MAG: Uncharacterized protein XD50_1471 [Clostridia bacterium 41_269]HBT20285.1 DUF1538 domain-containing protein [Peptococcaceae bacterium]
MKVINFFAGFDHVLLEVALALLPLTLLFIILQVWLLKFPKEKVYVIIKGLFLTLIGTSLFLQGVYMGFLPVGEVMRKTLGTLKYKWLIIPLGFVLGFVAVFAEPAVRVLNYEVEKASGGYIPQQLMLYTLSLGVAFSVALAMVRILYGVPLLYFIIPGYGLAFIMAHYSTPTFVAIAFDSGGVAAGPMTVTFFLAMALGIAAAIEGRNPLIEGFGMIALVALSPILAVLLLGLLYRRKEKQIEREITEM